MGKYLERIENLPPSCARFFELGALTFDSVRSLLEPVVREKRNDETITIYNMHSTALQYFYSRR